MFGAFPIVYQQYRGWSEGIGGLAFLGVAVGMLAAVVYTIPDNKRYNRIADAATKAGSLTGAPPEARLPPAILGSIFLPIGLFWFAWTNFPSVHWSVSIIGTAPFGFGMVLVFLSIMNYLIDSYTMYAASVLAANSVLRSLFGAIFPLFTSQMYARLGIHWASSVPAFLALACVPFPFLFYRYGASIRVKCKFARVAQEKMVEMMEVEEEEEGAGREGEEASTQAKGSAVEAEVEAEAEKREGGEGGSVKGVPREKGLEKDLEKGQL